MEDAWNNEQEKEEIRRLYAEARARMIVRRDESEPLTVNEKEKE